MLAALALVAVAPACPIQGGPAGALVAPGLVLHLTGDEASDAAQLARLGLEFEGFGAVAEGLVGPGYEVTLCSGESSKLAHLGGFELGPSSALELWIRPRGDDLEGYARERVLQLQGTGEPRSHPKLRLYLEHDGFHWGRGAGDYVELLPEELTADRWHHLAIAYDVGTTGTVRVVLDGKVQVVELGKSPEEARFDVGEDAGGTYLFVRVAGPDLAIELDELRLFDRYVSTAELRAHWQAGAGAHEVATVLTEPGLASAEAWAAGNFEQVVSEADGAAWVAGSWTQDHPAPGPHARTCHAVVPAGDGRLLVFGGELRDTHAGRMANGDDAWLYHLDEQRWERIAGGLTGRTSAELQATYAATFEALPPEPRPAVARLHPLRPMVVPDFEPAHGPAPAPRCHQGMAYDPTTKTAFLLGGWFNAPDGGHLYDDVWLLDLDDKAAPVWLQLPQSEPVPAITDVQPVFHAGLGRFLFLTRSAVWSLDPDDGALVRERDPLVLDQRLEPRVPRTTAQAMTWYDPDQGVVLRFGGFWVTPASEPGGERGLERTNALMAYAHELGAWVVTDTPEVAPSPRVRGAVAYDTRRKRSLLFGGITGGLDARTNDLWTYDARAKQWTQQRASNSPGPRGGYFGMAYDEERDVFVVPFGRQDQETFLDEVWRLRLRPESNGTATWRFDRNVWSAGLTPRLLCAAEDGTPVRAAGFAWRTSEDGFRWAAWSSFELGSKDTDSAGRYLEVRVTLAPGTTLTKLAFE